MERKEIEKLKKIIKECHRLSAKNTPTLSDMHEIFVITKEVTDND